MRSEAIFTAVSVTLMLLGLYVVYELTAINPIEQHHTYYYNISHDSNHNRSGKLSCTHIGKEGQFIKNMWQPTGCSMHNYTTSEFQSCLIERRKHRERWNHVLILGDSVMRQRYRALQSLIENTIPVYEVTHNEIVHKYPNMSTIIEYIFLPEGQPTLDFLKTWHVRYRNSTPDTIILGFSYWTMFRSVSRKVNPASEKYLNSYQNSVRQVVKIIEKQCNTTTTCIWVSQGPVNSTAISMRKGPADKNIWWRAISRYNAAYPHSNETVIDVYNNRALEIVNHAKKVNIWEVFYPVGKLYLNETQNGDGIHVSTKVLLLTRQILANYMCNTITRFQDATCCTQE